MSKPLKLVLFALVLSLPTAALAQSDDTAAPAEETADDDEFDFSDDGSGELLGGDENPDVPAYGFADRSAPKEDATKSAGPSGYPLRAIDRPINLPGGMSEITLTSDVNVDPFAVGGLLRGAYGITKEAQLSLNYGLGAFSDSNFSTGKAVALEGQYLIKNFLAVQIAVPVYLDPLAVGLVLGVPMRFQFFDKLRLDIGRDFLGIKLHEFLPSIENARENDQFIGDLKDNTITPQYTIKTSVIGTYQHTDATALNAELGVQFDDSESATTTLMHLGVLHSTSNKFDLGARVGTTDFAHFTDSFALRLFLRVRI